MRGAELYDRVINYPDHSGLTAMFLAGGAMIALAALLLSLGKLRIFARVLGILGIVTIMLGMFVAHEQTEKEKVGPFITVTRARYPEATRFQIRLALLGLPAAAAVVMATVFSMTRRRLRSSVPDHIKEGRKLLALGQHDQAMAQFNKALEIAPYMGEAYYQRACVHEARSEIDQAAADLDHALRCDPQHAHAYLRRGRIRTEKGELDGALADFDQVMIMRPNDAECYLHRGVCLAKKGILSDAIMDFQRVLKLTNHSDYAEPARYYLEQLGGEDPLSSVSIAPGANGSAQPPAAPAPSPPPDYVL